MSGFIVGNVRFLLEMSGFIDVDVRFSDFIKGDVDVRFSSVIGGEDIRFLSKTDCARSMASCELILIRSMKILAMSPIFRPVRTK